MSIFNRMEDDEEWSEEVRVVDETPTALLVNCEGVEAWVPRSLCRAGTEVEKIGDEGALALPHWLACEKGLA
jgi:hypothetical protein